MLFTNAFFFFKNNLALVIAISVEVTQCLCSCMVAMTSKEYIVRVQYLYFFFQYCADHRFYQFK